MDAPNPHRGKVVDLVNPYMTTSTSKANGGYRSPGTQYLQWWLEKNPGRWALISENDMGVSGDIVERLGFKFSVRNGGRQVYAQLPHPEGEDLRSALYRTAGKSLVDILPDVERDPFNWTPAELADAVQCARDNLFPVAERKAA